MEIKLKAATFRKPVVILLLILFKDNVVIAVLISHASFSSIMFKFSLRTVFPLISDGLQIIATKKRRIIDNQMKISAIL